MPSVFLCRFNINLCSWNQVLFWHDSWAILIRRCFSFSNSTVVRGPLILSFDVFPQFTVNLQIQHLILKAFHDEYFFKISLSLWFDSIKSLRISWIFFPSFSVSTVGSVLISGDQFCWHCSHERPFLHSVGILSTLQPRLPISAGFRSVGTCRQLIKSFSHICFSQIVYRLLFLSSLNQLNCQSIHKTFWLVALLKNLWYFYIDLLPYALPQVPVLI